MLLQQTGFGTGLANTIAAVRWTMTATYLGKPIIKYMKLERMHVDAAPDWEQPPGGEETGYRIAVTGDPSFTTEIGLSLAAGCAITALHPINAINAVCAAPPGIIGQLDMLPFWSKNVRRA